MLSQTNVFLLKRWTCFKLQWEVSILFYIFDMFILKEAIRQVILTWTAKFVGHNLRSIIGLNKKKIPLWGSSVGCGKKRCLFLQIFRHLILTLQVCKQDDMLEILANAKTTPGETCDSGAGDSFSSLLWVYIGGPGLFQSTTVPLKNNCTSFTDKSGVRSELHLYLHKRQFRSYLDPIT